MADTRIMIADDHRLFASFLEEFILEDGGFDLIGVAFSGKELLEMIHDNQPDLLLLDISLPDISGLELIELIKRDYPGIKILVISSHFTPEIISKALDQGASGYFTKSAGEVSDLIKAINDILAGNLYLCRLARETLSNEIAKAYTSTHRANVKEVVHEKISSREREIIGLISIGLTNKEIADKLNISIRTVQSHRKNIMQKLGVNKTAHLVKVAIEKGYIEKISG